MKKHRLRSQNKGFTLIELIAALGVLSIILTPLVMMSVRGITAYYHEQEKIDLMGSGQIALERISNTIRRRVAPVSQNTASLEVGEDIAYVLSGTDLMETDGGTPNEIANNVSAFDFTVDGSLLTIELELTGPKYGETIRLSTAIHLRNQE